MLSLAGTEGENYAKSTYVNYLAHSKYHGMASVAKQGEQSVEELKKYGIDDLLCWNDSCALPDSCWIEVHSFPESGLKVYRLK